MEGLQNRIKYQFKDKSILAISVTHSSYANEMRDKSGVSNERLEFLGDSVLGVVVSEYIYKTFQQLPEGELTKIRAALVCESSLYNFAKRIDLGNYLLLGKGEEQSGGRERASILSDAFEALIAAIYLDGGLDPARKFILYFVIKEIKELKQDPVFKDYKTALQEIVQKNKQEILKYVLVNESGPDHEKVFKVQVHLNSNVIGEGNGRSKKEAEQNAAKQVLELMGQA